MITQLSTSHPMLVFCAFINDVTWYSLPQQASAHLTVCSFALQVQATAAGTAHAIIMWWKLNLEQSGHITLDTAPPWVKSSGEAASLPPSVPKADASIVSMEHEELGGGQSGMQIVDGQPEQQWRDHWKQCWTPVQPHLTLGEMRPAYC